MTRVRWCHQRALATGPGAAGKKSLVDSHHSRRASSPAGWTGTPRRLMSTSSWLDVRASRLGRRRRRVRETDTTNTSDSTHAESTSTSLPAGQTAKAGGADSPHTHRVSDGGSGTESSSPDSSRDSWVVVLSEPDDQETAKAKATNNREEQAPRRLDDESFPPLPSRHTRPNCSEDIPITSCGRYILPGDAAHDDSTTLTGLFHQLPIASSSGDAPPSSPANTLPPELEQRRHRSRSRRRSATGTEDRRKEKGGEPRAPSTPYAAQSPLKQAATVMQH
ncbi:hypothetical protein MRX96_045001 [Rhipicephalus microplus]